MVELFFGSSSFKGYYNRTRALDLDRIGIGSFFAINGPSRAFDPTKIYYDNGKNGKAKARIKQLPSFNGAFYLQKMYSVWFPEWEPAEYLAAYNQAHIDHYANRRILIENVETGQPIVISMLCRGMSGYQAQQGIKFDIIRNYLSVTQLPVAYIVLKQRTPLGFSPVQALARYKGLTNKVRSFAKRRLGYNPQMIVVPEATKRGYIHSNIILVLEDQDDLLKLTGPIKTGYKGGRIDWQSSDIGSWMEAQGLGDAIHSCTIQTSWESKGEFEGESQEEAIDRFIGYVTKYVLKEMGPKADPYWNGLLKLSQARSFSISNGLLYQAVAWAQRVLLLGSEYEHLKARRIKVKKDADDYNKSLKESQEKYVKRINQFVANRTCLGTTSNSNNYNLITISEASEINAYLLNLTTRGLGRPPPGQMLNDYRAFTTGFLAPSITLSQPSSSGGSPAATCTEPVFGSDFPGGSRVTDGIERGSPEGKWYKHDPNNPPPPLDFDHTIIYPKSQEEGPSNQSSDQTELPDPHRMNPLAQLGFVQEPKRKRAPFPPISFNIPLSQQELQYIEKVRAQDQADQELRAQYGIDDNIQGPELPEQEARHVIELLFVDYYPVQILNQFPELTSQLYAYLRDHPEKRR